jgi:hypothetical protein
MTDADLIEDGVGDSFAMAGVARELNDGNGQPAIQARGG